MKIEISEAQAAVTHQAIICRIDKLHQDFVDNKRRLCASSSIDKQLLQTILFNAGEAKLLAKSSIILASSFTHSMAKKQALEISQAYLDNANQIIAIYK